MLRYLQKHITLSTEHFHIYVQQVAVLSFIYRHQAFYLTSSITCHTMVGLIHQASDFYSNASSIVSSLTWMLLTNLRWVEACLLHLDCPKSHMYTRVSKLFLDQLLNSTPYLVLQFLNIKALNIDYSVSSAESKETMPAIQIPQLPSLQVLPKPFSNSPMVRKRAALATLMDTHGHNTLSWPRAHGLKAPR